jgi:KDO2-lipid IV(A) lauroyltransferase
MSEWLLLKLVTLLGYTPLLFNQWLGRRIGSLVYFFGERERAVALINLQLCFPEQTAQWRKTIAKKSLQAMAESFLESPRLWRMPLDTLRNLCINPEALQIINEAMTQGKGVIAATPHLGSWEYTGLIVSDHIPLTGLYRPPKIQALDDSIREGRERTGSALVPTTASGVKALTRTLRENGLIGILPDQEATGGSGVFAPFFETPAFTTHLLPRLARRQDSPVIFLFAERLPHARFRLHVISAPDEIHDKDDAVACSAMNAVVEKLVRIKPEQYNWSYKRFNETPDGSRRYPRKKKKR